MGRYQYIRTLTCLFILLLILCSVESGTALTIFYSGEENGQLGLHGCGSEQVGGLAHRHTLLLALRTDLDAVLNLHAGNLIDATDGNAEWIYQIGLSALDAMGIDVLCLGPQELSFSSETLAALHANHPNIAFTCANAKQGVVSPYLIHKVSSMNVAVVGLISETYTQEPYKVELTQPLTVLAELKSQIGIGKLSTINTSSSGKNCIKMRLSFSFAWYRFRRLLLKRDLSGKCGNKLQHSALIILYPASSVSLPTSSNNQEIQIISLSGQRLFGPGQCYSL